MTHYTISTGRSRMEQEWMAKSVTWQQLTDRLSRCKRTGESFAEYRSWSKQDKGKAKDVGGFVGGSLTAPQRKACYMGKRSLVTLDIDYGQPDSIDTISVLLDCAWCLYSTHSHSSETPRYRLIIPLSREVTPDEYIPIARRIAETIGIDTFDDSTYEPHRLMFWPSAARDGEFVFETGAGEPLDADKTLATYTDWRDVSEWPVSKRQTSKVTTRGGKSQEDPTTKPGIIGAFCRTYSISEAISTFLSDIYEPAGENRYTYLLGSSAGGAVVYEDKWLFSHHGTDPCGEREVNAFDLVRIHKFGSDDNEADPDTPVNRLPSFTRMSAFAQTDRKVNGTMVRERIGTAAEAFGDIEDESENDGSTDDWKELLKFTKTGLVATPANYNLILTNDKGLKGIVKHDSFRDKNVLQRDLPWRPAKLDRYWTNSDDVNLVGYVSRQYGGSPVTKTTLLDEWDAVISQNCYHPVRDYLNTLQWDGTSRLDTLIIDYLGAADCPLTRAMTRKHLVAAVARIMLPGIKYDYVLTLSGAEGLGKSTLIRALGKDWFDDSFSPSNIGDKEAMEQLRGQWLIEMGELKDYKKSTVESFKAFISKQEDQYRPAYGRKSETYLRQCVFFATTNEKAFLKGDTGNRRFWAIEVGEDIPSKDVFKLKDMPEEVDQIWAEALHYWKHGEPLYLDGELEAQARKRQAEYNEITTDDRIGVIAACIRRHLPMGWWDLNRKQRRDFFKDCAPMHPSDPYIKRETICAMEVQEEFFGVQYDRYKSKEINQIFGVLGFRPAGSIRVPDKEYGRQRRYLIPESFFAEE